MRRQDDLSAALLIPPTSPTSKRHRRAFHSSSSQGSLSLVNRGRSACPGWGVGLCAALPGARGPDNLRHLRFFPGRARRRAIRKAILDSF